MKYPFAGLVIRTFFGPLLALAALLSACGSDDDSADISSCELRFAYSPDAKGTVQPEGMKSIVYRAEFPSDCKHFVETKSGALGMRLDVSGVTALGYLTAVKMDPSRSLSFPTRVDENDLVRGYLVVEREFKNDLYGGATKAWLLPWAIPLEGVFPQVEFVVAADAKSEAYPRAVTMSLRLLDL